MVLSISTWEILEAYTKGLGESEGLGNHTIDVVIAFIGYFIVILIFSYKDIPWITAKRGVHCCSCSKHSKIEKSISMIQVNQNDDENGNGSSTTNDDEHQPLNHQMSQSEVP